MHMCIPSRPPTCLSCYLRPVYKLQEVLQRTRGLAPTVADLEGVHLMHVHPPRLTWLHNASPLPASPVYPAFAESAINFDPCNQL